MGESKLITFTMPEIAEVLVKRQDIHEGLWGIYVKFGIGAANVPGGPEEGSTEKGNILPAAIVPVLELGIQKFDAPNSLTVDASRVNPGGKKKRSHRKTA